MSDKVDSLIGKKCCQGWREIFHDGKDSLCQENEIFLNLCIFKIHIQSYTHSYTRRNRYWYS